MFAKLVSPPENRKNTSKRSKKIASSLLTFTQKYFFYHYKLSIRPFFLGFRFFILYRNIFIATFCLLKMSFKITRNTVKKFIHVYILRSQEWTNLKRFNVLFQFEITNAYHDDRSHLFLHNLFSLLHMFCVCMKDKTVTIDIRFYIQILHLRMVKIFDRNENVNGPRERFLRRMHINNSFYVIKRKILTFHKSQNFAFSVYKSQ